jgi:hypothetical protein
MAELAGDREHEADSDTPSDQGSDPARGAQSIPQNENAQMHLSANRLGRKILGPRRMPRMQTVVELAFAIGSVVAGDTTLALASDPKSSCRVPLPRGVAGGCGVEAE